MPLPARQTSVIEEIVNVRLDDIVYWIYQAQPATFPPPERFLGALQRQFEEDRRALQSGEAPAEEHFIRGVKKHSANSSHRMEGQCMMSLLKPVNQHLSYHRAKIHEQRRNH